MRMKRWIIGGTLAVMCCQQPDLMRGQDEPQELPAEVAEVVLAQDPVEMTQDSESGRITVRLRSTQQGEVAEFQIAESELRALVSLRLQQQIHQLAVTMQSLSAQLEQVEVLQLQLRGPDLPAKEKLHEASEVLGRALKEYLVALESDKRAPARQESANENVVGRDDRDARMKKMHEYLQQAQLPAVSLEQAAEARRQAQVAEERVRQMQEYFQHLGASPAKSEEQKAEAQRQAQTAEQRMKQLQDYLQSVNPKAANHGRPQANPVELQARAAEARAQQARAQQVDPAEIIRQLDNRHPRTPEWLEKLESRLDRIEAQLQRLIKEESSDEK